MDLEGTFRNIIRTLKFSKKSDRRQFMLYLKLVLLGVGVVGGLAFVIHLIATVTISPLAAFTSSIVVALEG